MNLNDLNFCPSATISYNLLWYRNRSLIIPPHLVRGLPSQVHVYIEGREAGREKPVRCQLILPLIILCKENPYSKIEFIVNDLNVSRITAANYLNKLADDRILRKERIGTGNYYKLFNLLAKR